MRNNPLLFTAVIIAAVISATLCAVLKVPTPDFVPALGLAAIGALAGVAVPGANASSSSRQEPAPQQPVSAPVAPQSVAQPAYASAALPTVPAATPVTDQGSPAAPLA